MYNININIYYLCSNLKYVADRPVPCLMTDQVGEDCWEFCLLTGNCSRVESLVPLIFLKITIF